MYCRQDLIDPPSLDDLISGEWRVATPCGLALAISNCYCSN